jgi:hypothetical protein
MSVRTNTAAPAPKGAVAAGMVSYSTVGVLAAVVVKADAAVADAERTHATVAPPLVALVSTRQTTCSAGRRRSVDACWAPRRP